MFGGNKWIIGAIALVGAIIVVIPLVGVTVSYVKAYSQPYGKADLSAVDVPVFTEVALPFSHEFDLDKSLPFLGSAIIDVDGDGTPEVFLGGAYDQQDAILRFDGTAFSDVTATMGQGLNKSLPDTSYGAAVLDVNDDGRADLFVARDSGITLYLNKVGGFEANKLDIPFNSKSVPLSITLADLNNDGYADMFVSNYIKLDQVEGQNIFNQEGYGATSLLLLNNGDNTFKDITVEAGVEYVHNTFVAVFSDVDRDGDQDIVVAHDTGHVLTWRNNGDLTFTSVDNPWSEVLGYPMGVAVGDYNNDALIDFYFSNVSTTAPRFLASGDIRDDQTFFTPYMLFRNDGDFAFTDVGSETLTADYEFAWGVVFDDLNNDGKEDLLVSQNYVSLPLQKIFQSPGRVLLQMPDGTFATAEEEMGLTNRQNGITPLVADFNNDGYRDIVLVNLGEPSRAFISNGGDAHFLKVRLPETVRSLGALVEVTRADGTKLTQQFTSGEGMSSDQSHELIFGLGDQTAVGQVTIHYANGDVREMGSQAADTTLTVN